MIKLIKSENIKEPKKTLLTSVFVLRDKLEASLGVYLLFHLLFYWGFLFGLVYLVVFNCYEKKHPNYSNIIPSLFVG